MSHKGTMTTDTYLMLIQYLRWKNCLVVNEHSIVDLVETSILDVMPESHERILRRIIRRFGSFPTTTYSNRIPSDVNVHITYEERSGRFLNLNKTCA